ncbi:TIGR03885 family FMN-dependent LLM class oxidoreductase [Rhodoligotrophos defluvii]|uniref:TIGR03885 family FMN-dependent LLM class oxidoreductase n=1 Tax=Rhodoligotrophos defluvii TaxID=2561934 RepID=UPI0010C9F0E6|nr:TIGR03885 family FMN-dependent LLM class oxidoreductase [Rhodoligotrophos defluvii]
MPKIGYHASHEQFAPSELLAHVELAAKAGFTAAMSSDHFAPWSEAQGHSGFAWTWLGAAMAKTELPFGVVTTPIGMRYHPAIIAQAGATLAEMFPGRLWMALGSGEALNERITGQRWPLKAERDARLKESAEIIRALWAGETVTRHGLIPVEEARLYSRPNTPPRIIAAALTPETARWAGGWADGLITINKPGDQLKAMVDAFREGGGGGKPLFLQVHLSFAGSEQEARRNAHEQWRTNTLAGSVAAELKLPAQFDAATRFVRPEDLDESVRISAGLTRHIDWIAEDLALGFEEIHLHNVGRNQRDFIEAFGDRVLPAVLGAAERIASTAKGTA